MTPRRFRLAFALLLAGVAIVTLSSRVRDVRSDPRATLVATQVLLEHGTLAMDSLGPTLIRDYGYVLAPHGGHYYSRFPLGSSLLSLPFVLVARVFGMDLRQYEHERLLQVLIVTLISLAVVTLLVRLARLWLTPGYALLLAALTWFGSAFASTQATALWSHDFATLGALAAIFASVRATRAGAPVPGWLVGTLLFLAYLCRPTLSVLAPALLLYVLCYDRRAALTAAVALTLGLALFVTASELGLGQPLPDYYLPQRLSGSAYGTALLGNLVSPSRGLFVYSPLLLFPLLFLPASARGLARQKPIAFIAVAWPLAHLLLVSRLRHWWGGFSFGPRFLTDALPGLFVLLAVTLNEALVRRRRIATLVLTLLGALSVLVNTVQGLYNRAPKAWNAEPSIDQHPELVFDWRYPQFLNTEARQRARLAALRLEGMNVEPAP